MTIAALIAANTTSPSAPVYSCDCYVDHPYGDENWDMDTRTLTMEEARHLVDEGYYTSIFVSILGRQDMHVTAM